MNHIVNMTDEWVQFPRLSEDIPSGPPPARAAGAPVPDHHELRPGEAFYDSDLMPLPPADVMHTAWGHLLEFLWARSRVRDSRYARFMYSYAVSCREWASDFVARYPSQAACAAVPGFRRRGWEPWANGHPGGNHYASATYLLQEDSIAGDKYLFCDRVCHLAGQGVDHRYGSLRYEKSSWWTAGDARPDSKRLWSHAWPEILVIYQAMTGEMEDVVNRVMEFALREPPRWQGWWGTRGVAWYLRFLRSIWHMMPAYKAGVEGLARKTIEDFVRVVHVANLGYPPNYGASWDCDVWMDMLACSEASMWCASAGWEDLLDDVMDIADYHVRHNMSADGALAYRQVNGAPVWGSWALTSCAIPVMTAMVQTGRLDQSRLKLPVEYLLNHLPADGFALNGPEGPAAPKTYALALFGLRPDFLKVAGVE